MLGSLLAIGLGGAAYLFFHWINTSGITPSLEAMHPGASNDSIAPTADIHFVNFIDTATTPFSNLTTILTAIQAEPDETLQEAAWDRLEVHLAETSGLPASVAHYSRLHASAAELELGRRLLRRWADIDAPEAAHWAVRQPAGDPRQQAIDMVATRWADADLPAAIDWAARIPAGPDRQSALIGISYEAARTEPISALALALELPENKLRDDLLSHATAQCASLDPVAAIEVAREFPDALLRDRLIGAIAITWADTDPVAAAKLVGDSLTTPRLRDDAMISVVQRWAQKDIKAAAAWVATWPAGPLHDTAQTVLDQLPKS